MKFEDLDVGQVYTKKEEGILFLFFVSRRGRTLLHKHKFIETIWLKGYWNEIVYNKGRYYQYDKLPEGFKLIGRI